MRSMIFAIVMAVTSLACVAPGTATADTVGGGSSAPSSSTSTTTTTVTTQDTVGGGSSQTVDWLTWVELMLTTTGAGI
ncbi:MAG: hypothetical protein PVJ40_03650 [Gammaproteobacteria bacterium]